MDEPGETAVVDWAAFARMRAELGPDFIRILGYFREDGEKSVARIEAAMHSRDCAALVIPAHTMKSESRQFGAEPLGDLAEEIELAGRRGVESHLFPDQILPQVARLRPLYEETMALFEQETNPLVARRPSPDRAASNQDFGRL
ncbi:MAG TPA: Hpt domain-containing protein [Allosphingosinicella sp.]|nr:Hpt domain-containing protein [Allosphingosinicella sp.]